MKRFIMKVYENGTLIYIKKFATHKEMQRQGYEERQKGRKVRLFLTKS